MKSLQAGKVALFVGVLAVIGLADRAGARENAARPHPRRAEVRTRQHLQHDRIQQGVRTGELTREEAKTLKGEQKEIRQEKREMLADDGRLDRGEARELRHDQNQASQNIYEEKHDAEKR